MTYEVAIDRFITVYVGKSKASAMREYRDAVEMQKATDNLLVELYCDGSIVDSNAR